MFPYLTPSFLDSDFLSIFEMHNQLVSSWKDPLQSATVRCQVFDWALDSHFLAMDISEWFVLCKSKKGLLTGH